MHPWQVPVLVAELDSLTKASWDLCLLKIIPYIDGVFHVKRIAAESEVDCKLVQRALRQLLYYGCIALSDIFQFSNVYAVTAKMSEFSRHRQMARECVEYVVGPEPPPFSAPSPARPSFRRVFKVYSELARGVPMRELCLRARLLREGLIDVRRFVTFGVVNGIIRRVHRYPVLAVRPAVANTSSGALSALSGSDGTPPSSSALSDLSLFPPVASPSVSPQPSTRSLLLRTGMDAAQLLALFNGERVTDEICCELGLSWGQVEVAIRPLLATRGLTMMLV